MLDAGNGLAGVAIHSNHRGLLRQQFKIRVSLQVVKPLITEGGDSPSYNGRCAAVWKEQCARGEHFVAKYAQRPKGFGCLSRNRKTL
jgi:hypothetical protein